MQPRPPARTKHRRTANSSGGLIEINGSAGPACHFGLPDRLEDVGMNREMAEIIRNQKPLMLPPTATVQEACQHMHANRFGAVLVTNPKDELVGIFTGRDAVRILAEGQDLSLIHI